MSREFNAVHRALEAAREEHQTYTVERGSLEADIRGSMATIEHLKEVLPRLRAAQLRAAELSQKWCPERPLKSLASLIALQKTLQEAQDLAREEARKREAALQEVDVQIEQLEWSGGTFSEALLNARDYVGGELLAGHFDDISVEDAGRVEALLGPLVEAIIVDDAHQAAQELAELSERPPTVWFIDEQSELDLLVDDPTDTTAAEFDGAVFVASPEGSRLSTVSKKPTLGRRARLQRLDELCRERARLEQDLEEASLELRQVNDGLRATILVERSSGVLRTRCARGVKTSRG